MPVPRRVALIHAMPVAIEPICRAFAELWPDARTTNFLDDSLGDDLAAAGSLDEAMIERFRSLARYAENTRADGILFTCSAFGKAIESARSTVGVPVLTPNEAMLDEALVEGERIGLLATFEPSVPSMVAEIQALAQERGRAISVDARVVPGALAALKRGRPDEHDAAIAKAAAEYDEVDVLILAQFSMASALGQIPRVHSRRVLTSPGSAVRRLRALLA